MLPTPGEDLLGLQHAALPFPGTAEAIDEARRFYVDGLGLFELAVPPEMTARASVMWFRAGGGEIHLFEEPSGVAVNAESRRHPCLEVRDLAAYRSRVEGNGVATITAEPALAARPRFFVVDPFGNAVEFIQLTG